MVSFALTLLFLVAPLTHGAYKLVDDYTPANFGSKFNFNYNNDKTGGYVNYVTQDQAIGRKYFRVQNNQVYIGVDSTNKATGRGRDSVRIESKTLYTHGLFIVDLQHMPASTCGTWPAFWLFGDDWPNNGEIDIIEGVNTQTTNLMTLHTSQGCIIQRNANEFSGQVQTTSCWIDDPTQYANQGCAVKLNDGSSYGTGFNAIGGGVYATQWESDSIKIWFFPRSKIPADIKSGNPNPSGWGKPNAKFFGSGCNIDQKFKRNKITINVTFCGKWAGDPNVWGPSCAAKTRSPTCNAYVQNNPAAFKDTYWLINSLRVYKQ